MQGHYDHDGGTTVTTLSVKMRGALCGSWDIVTCTDRLRTNAFLNPGYPYMTEEYIIKIVLDEAFHVHKKIGPGMLESVYKTCLAYRLQKRGLLLEMEKPVPVFFEEVKMDCGYRADILVEKKVIVETKSIEGIGPLQVAQVLTFVRFLGLRMV